MSFPGGKGACFRRLINLMPPHRTYIETHLGGGAVMLAKRPAENSIGIDIDAGVIARWGEAPGVSNIDLVHRDAVGWLNEYRWTGDELVYSDPPYVLETRQKKRIYRHEYDDGDHYELLVMLKALPCAVIVSGYWSELYASELADWRCEEIPNTTRGGARMERAWCNFPPPEIPHDTRYLGDTFRERERIQRRRRRWGRRFAELLPSEQVAMLEHLLGTASPKVASAAVIATASDEDLTARSSEGRRRRSPESAMKASIAGNSAARATPDMTSLPGGHDD